MSGCLWLSMFYHCLVRNGNKTVIMNLCEKNQIWSWNIHFHNINHAKRWISPICDELLRHFLGYYGYLSLVTMVMRPTTVTKQSEHYCLQSHGFYFRH